jgi:hypothetical protein
MLTPQQFARELGCDTDRLDRLYDNVPNSYREWEVEKRSGGTRTIAAPVGFLNCLQQRIQRRFLEGRQWLPCVHGVEGRGHLHNARQHLGKKHHFVTDILEFFPSVDPYKVNRAFRRELDFSPGAARYAMRLTTRDGSLPQGAYTSPRVADLVFRPIDERLLQFCDVHNITYTRYADDLAFSSQEDFEGLTGQIKRIIKKEDFQPHRGKTRYRVGEVEVTGVIVENNRLRAPDRVKEKLSEFEEGSPAHQALVSYINRIESG